MNRNARPRDLEFLLRQVAIDAKGRTQVGNLFAAVLGVLTIAFLLPLFENLALTVLAAIVIVVMSGLSDLGYFRTLWRVRKLGFLVALAGECNSCSASSCPTAVQSAAPSTGSTRSSEVAPKAANDVPYGAEPCGVGQASKSPSANAVGGPLVD